MSVLICGSLAYDNIMVFPDRFKNHILPDKIHMLSVSFLVPEMRREFGGCAGNTGYSLQLLGDEPVIYATAGSDFAPYAAHLDQLGITRDGIKVLDEHFTGQCFITTDLDDNQIAAFHPGAMSFAHFQRVADAPRDIKLGIVMPDGKQGMVEHSEQFAAAGIPFIFDPGQGLPMFDGAELLRLIDLADYLTLNDYEAEMVMQKTGLTLEQLAGSVKALVITLGAEGAQIHAGGVRHDIPAVPAAAVIDPTGCGDAFRAGLLYGIARGWSWPQTGRLASLLGSLKIAQRGAQNHTFTPESIRAQYAAAFGEAWPA
ncbi:Adenosine kinase [Andreprevotia sp. IGB-42]|uniref:carbohydrate kinase family protein n=1 Tax=Andreprevotia sp. IGB-42 TaxID=2497473 RepID=UPI001357DCBB|nr:carbohydrate kinase family protein [Andreprevotia sp. IGB-42]KAF0812270.1 Adenosine kinase [Andreprevotia sp. IGB-42]